MVELSRARGAGHQHRAVGAPVAALEALQHLGREAQLAQLEGHVALVQHPDDDLLAVHGGQAGDAQVGRAPGDGEADAAVLGHPALGDVEVGHDLDPADHAPRDAARDGGRLAQNAVDAVAHDHLAGLGLEMDVGGALLHRSRDDRVHEAHHRRLVNRVVEVQGADAVVGARLLGQVLHDLVHLARLAEHRGDVLGQGEHGADVAPGDHAQVVDRQHIERIGHRHHERAVRVEAHGDGGVAARRAVVDQVGHARVDPVGQALEVHAHPLRDRSRDLVAGQAAVGHEQIAQPAPVGLLAGQHVLELCGRDQAHAHQHLAQGRGAGHGHTLLARRRGRGGGWGRGHREDPSRGESPHTSAGEAVT